MKDTYDAIVVGAGPAGCAAAYTLAAGGVSVALLERGSKPGSKNMFGGTIYRIPTEEIIPGFWQKAPLERAVISDQLWIMEQDSAVNIGFTGLKYSIPPYNKFTAIRTDFDSWFAQQAVKVGARLYTKALVKELLYEKKLLGKGPINGVKMDTGDKLYANCVILCEGVNAFLTKQAGLRSKIPPHAMTLYCKEVLELPGHIIEERFNLEKGLGAIMGMVGYPTAGAVGKGGIWTNKNSLSLMVGGYLDQLAQKKLSPYILLQRLKQHPLVRKLIQGAKVIEYQAHMIPKGGYHFIPNLYSDGLLVAGDAAVMISGRRGTDLAMLSGKYAAEAVIAAKAKEDFSAETLRSYQVKLNNTFFMKDIKSSRNVLDYYKDHPDSDFLMSKFINDAAYHYFTTGMQSEKKVLDNITKELTILQLPLKSIKDIYAGLKYWGVF
ncbi:MAG: FAD-dependent oxidoreductase [Clostridia bacterium]|nr:FAD-dependent oxidoreductase [Clostridia bacterium]